MSRYFVKGVRKAGVRRMVSRRAVGEERLRLCRRVVS